VKVRVRGHLQDFLGIYGVTLNDVKVLMRSRDERMRERPQRTSGTW
jgi:hypothetical protein